VYSGKTIFGAFSKLTLAIGAAMACWLFLLGCQSTGKPASARFASVEIQGNTPGQIRDMTTQVFTEHQYHASHSNMDSMVFEKEGTGWNNVAYGNWTGEGVWERVKASIVPVSEGKFRLQCNAYMVRDKGGTTEEEIKLSSLKSHRYQKLLNEVSQRFRGTTSTAK